MYGHDPPYKYIQPCVIHSFPICQKKKPPPKKTPIFTHHEHPESGIRIRQIPLIPLHGPLLALRKVDVRTRVSQLGERLGVETLVRREDGLALHVAQLGDPVANIRAAGIALFRLHDRVEDGVAGFPALGVVREIPVDQVFREEAFAAPVVDQEVGAEVRRDVHAEAIVHVGLVAELTHAGVDKGHAGRACAPFAPAGVVCFFFPFHVVEFEVLREVHGVVRRDHQHLAVELAEDELAHPGRDARVAVVGEVRACLVVRGGGGERLADGDDAAGEVGGEAGGGVFGGLAAIAPVGGGLCL